MSPRAPAPGWRGWLALAGGMAGGLALAVRARRTGFSFQNRVVVITGGTRGLGLCLARELAREGARLALCARDASELLRAKEELAAGGAQVFAQACDITDREQVERFLEEVRHELGAVDVLFNNAGIIQVGPAQAMRLEDYKQALQTHFWGPLYFIQGVLPEMRRRRFGRIVNITSIGGKVAVPHLLPYDASKFALVGLSEGLHAELETDGIRVTTVCPGLMRTGSPRNAVFKGRHRAEYTWFSLGAALPLGSMSAERAARKIVRACRLGRTEVFLTVSAGLAARIQGLAPSFMGGLLAMANRLLPTTAGGSGPLRTGDQSETALTRSWLTTLSRRAERRNNELPV